MDPVPPRYYEKDIPPAIQNIILQCLKRNPDDRPQSIPNLIKEVKNYQLLDGGKYGELVTKPLSLMSYFNFSKAQYFSPLGRTKSHRRAFGKQLLGCIADHDNSNAVIDYSRRQATLYGGNITLLHVIEEDRDNEFEKFAQEVEGSSLTHRLDHYLTELNHYELSPHLRIKRGNAAEVIIEMARELAADFIIIGHPRKRSLLSKIFSGSVMEKIIEAELTNVTVAQSKIITQPPDLTGQNSLTTSDLNSLEIFLSECWVEHLDMLLRHTQTLFERSDDEINQIEFPCRLEQWLVKINEQDNLRSTYEIAADTHRSYHSVVQSILQQANYEKPEQLRKIYVEKALPLLTELKLKLRSIIVHIRTKI